MFLPLALVIAMPPFQQQWQQVDSDQDGSLFIDTRSIRSEGPLRVYRSKLVKPGDPRVFEMEVEVDCAVKSTSVRSGRLFQDGKQVAERTIPPTQRRIELIPDPANDPVLKLVCTR